MSEGSCAASPLPFVAHFLDDRPKTQEQVRLVYDFVAVQLHFIFDSPRGLQFLYQLGWAGCYIGRGQGRRQSASLA